MGGVNIGEMGLCVKGKVVSIYCNSKLLRFSKVKKGETITKEETYDFFREKAAGFKFLIHIVCLDELPMTSTGKIKKVE